MSFDFEVEYRCDWHSWWAREFKAAAASGDEARLETHLALDPPWVGKR